MGGSSHRDPRQGGLTGASGRVVAGLAAIGYDGWMCVSLTQAMVRHGALDHCPPHARRAKVIAASMTAEQCREGSASSRIAGRSVSVSLRLP